MIRLNRQGQPQVLIDNKDEWLRQLQADLANGLSVNQSTFGKKYNHADVKAVLMTSSNSKCMYCESSIRHVDHGEIEHIKPKATFPTQIFEWENLGFVCSVCNNNKSDKYDNTDPIVDPYADDPSIHLVPVGPTYFPVPGNNRGQTTINDVKLNRVELVERRAERIKQLHNLLERASRLTETLRNAIQAEIQDFVNHSSEYSAASQAALKAFNGNTR